MSESESESESALFAKCVHVTVHTAGRDEEHADEDVLQNNSL